jgi:Xaa-Pro aminopeptidase
MSAYAERRQRLIERAGRGAVLVFPSAPVAIRNNDVEHDYRQDSDFHYLTGFDEPESVLVLATEHAEHRVVLFVRPRDPDREIWDGAREGVDGAVKNFGADAAFPMSELASRLPEYLKAHERLVYRIGRDRKFDDRVLAALDVARSQVRAGFSSPTQIIDPVTLVHEMRLCKSEEEIATMRKAAAITREAHVGAMRLAKPGRFEYEVEALLCEVFRRNGSERPAYAPIVGSGANATVLHYRSNRKRIEEGDLLLVDAGCEYGYYASDVTRTYPVSGKFSEAQRSVYEIVLAAENAGIAAVKPGVTLDEIHKKCVDVVVDGLMGLGLLSGDSARIMGEAQYLR